MQHSNSKRPCKRIDYRLLHHTGQVREKTIQELDHNVSDSFTPTHYSFPDVTAQVEQPIVSRHNQSDVSYNVTGDPTISNSQYNLILQHLPMDDQSSDSEDLNMDARLLRQVTEGLDHHEQAPHHEPPPQDSVSSSHHDLSLSQHGGATFQHNTPPPQNGPASPYNIMTPPDDRLSFGHGAPPDERDVPPRDHDNPPLEHDALSPQHNAPMLSQLNTQASSQLNALSSLLNIQTSSQHNAPMLSQLNTQTSSQPNALSSQLNTQTSSQPNALSSQLNTQTSSQLNALSSHLNI